MRKPQQRRQSLKMRERWAKRKKWKNVSGGGRGRARQIENEAENGRERVKNGPTREISPPDLTVGLTDCVCAQGRRPPRKQYSPSFLHLRSFSPIILWRASESLAPTKRIGGVLVVNSARQSHRCLLARPSVVQIQADNYDWPAEGGAERGGNRLSVRPSGPLVC